MLDNDIAHYEKNVTKLQAQIHEEKCKLSDLKSYRAHIQKGIEADIASMESNTGE
jgi:hypothetical protein